MSGVQVPSPASSLTFLQLKMQCLNCPNKLKRKNYKYCSNLCQANYQYKKFIEQWKSGLISGGKGQKCPQISNHLKRYLLEKFGEQCCICGWKERHSITQRVPLEINHIDGNSLNNIESNLQLICPNCHSLTQNFRNLNKGNGRTFRRKRAIFCTKLIFLIRLPRASYHFPPLIKRVF